MQLTFDLMITEQTKMNCRWCYGNLSKPILSFKNFPMYPSSVKRGELKDKFNNYYIYDFEIAICKSCKLIQQLKNPNFEILYAFSRNEGFGPKWKNHYHEFSKFITNFKIEGSYLEIGGGNLVLAKNLFDSGIKDISIVEIDQKYKDKNFKFYNNKFESIHFKEKFNVIYSSHVFEHIDDFHKHLDQILLILNDDGLLFISLPDFEQWIDKFYLNSFVQDHIVYPTKNIIIEYLSKYFQPISYRSFEDHSIFLCFKKKSKSDSTNLSLNKSTFNDSKNLVKEFQSNLAKLDDFFEKKLIEFENLYLFGSNIFSQILLSLPSLKKRKINGILDNSKLKQNRFLYNFDVEVFSPNILEKLKYQNIILVVFAGAYENEIIKQILNINSYIKIISTSDFKNYLLQKDSNDE